MEWPDTGESIGALIGIPLLLIVLLLAEARNPFRPAVSATARRWVINAALYLISMLIAGGLALDKWPLGFSTISWLDQTCGAAVAIVFALLALDLVFYGLHRLQHAWAFLWRLHLVHHCDIDLDASTAVRHHPGEALVNGLTFGIAIVLLGIPPGTIALYGALAIAVQMLQHANIAWPAWAEQAAALVLVTPALHRRHHSDERSVSDTNFGTIFSIWDRLFGSLDAHSGVAGYGVDGVGRAQCRSLWGILTLPLAWRPHAPEE